MTPQYSEQLKNTRVLVVDDEADIRFVLDYLLTERGATVCTAENGADALRQIRKERPDVMILDLSMPVMDGFEFRKEQLRDPSLARIPVVVATAAYGEEVKDVLGQVSFLRKPFCVESLMVALHRAITQWDPLPAPAAVG